jgi:RNA polymerase sigma-70 factor (ECF subfamily)
MTDWDTIVREHAPLVWRTVYRLLGNEADAADCFQETFVAACRKATGGPVLNWPGLLRTTATARALDRLRRRTWQRSHTAELTEGSGATADADDPVCQAQNAELADRMRRALAGLSAKQSEAFCLRHLNELSYEQIAQELDVSVDHVGVLLNRARARLRDLLNQGRRAGCRL